MNVMLDYVNIDVMLDYALCMQCMVMLIHACEYNVGCMDAVLLCKVGFMQMKILM